MRRGGVRAGGLAASLLALGLAVPAQAAAPSRISPSQQLSDGNKSDRLEWFRDLGFGMFVHWSVDSQIGSVISHSLVGADAAYTRRFFEDLPKTFNPRKYHPEDWAVLAKLAGMKYVVFTAKHHSGFCMYETKTTGFGVLRTPYGKDVTADLVKAFRAQGIAVGFYFSPDDFHWLYENGKTIDRDPRPGVTPQENPKLMEHDQAQIRELLTQYGPIDLLFIDGPAAGLRELAWKLQPDIVVTRGAIETPEQKVRGVPLDRAWESCITMGTAWQYKPAHESYKSSTEVLELLIETRAKGGNLLLNVGPKPDGELPIEQEERLRAIGLWNMAFGEAIDGVRPWVVSNEGDVWFTKHKTADTVYAFVTKTGGWRMGDRRTLTLRSVRATEATKVSILGETGEVLEYRPDVDPRPSWRQDADGLHVEVTLAQRFYDNRQWPEPVAVKITNVTAGLRPPVVETGDAVRRTPSSATLNAALADLGQAPSVEVGFEYRRKKRGEELYEKEEVWKATPAVVQKSPGPFSASIDGLLPDEAYEYRAAVKHPLLAVYGDEKTLSAR
jgi:alpha-L-fucosidase